MLFVLLILLLYNNKKYNNKLFSIRLLLANANIISFFSCTITGIGKFQKLNNCYFVINGQIKNLLFLLICIYSKKNTHIEICKNKYYNKIEQKNNSDCMT